MEICRSDSQATLVDKIKIFNYLICVNSLIEELEPRAIENHDFTQTSWVCSLKTRLLFIVNIGAEICIFVEHIDIVHFLFFTFNLLFSDVEIWDYCLAKIVLFWSREFALIFEFVGAFEVWVRRGFVFFFDEEDKLISTSLIGEDYFVSIVTSRSSMIIGDDIKVGCLVKYQWLVTA